MKEWEGWREEEGRKSLREGEKIKSTDLVSTYPVLKE